ncbi:MULTISPECIES: GUN4 domain-containing protein [unclassified Anabaena]|uniref:GUN4 domain-containing protein n=1 Tax=unclassified Anabaena TaxID=2619674 RepID=UPI000836E6D5|nr:MULTISPECIES: GUN4 domain-containing protein [unclassified Anabaena]
MFKADKNQSKTPLGYYERAIEELRRSREELQEMKAIYLQKIDFVPQPLQSEIQELKTELKHIYERLEDVEKKAAETQMSLADMEEAALTAQQELQTIKENMINERKFNEQIIEELAQIKEQVSHIVSQTQPIDSQTQILQSLSNLQLQLSELTAELTLVSHTSGVDYRQLQQLLAENRWQEADKETYLNLLKICNRQEEGWLDDDQIKKLPRHDIVMINNLWVKYSQGRFGFSIQKTLWEARKEYKHFAYRVGWLASLANSEWVKYDDYTFNLDANKGHLPSTSRLVGLGCRNVGEVAHRLKVFLSRY